MIPPEDLAALGMLYFFFCSPLKSSLFNIVNLFSSNSHFILELLGKDNPAVNFVLLKVTLLQRQKKPISGILKYCIHDCIMLLILLFVDKSKCSIHKTDLVACASCELLRKQCRECVQCVAQV